MSNAVNLGLVTPPEVLAFLNQHFDFDVSKVRVEWGESDGAGNKGASAKSAGLFSDDGVIIFDPADFPRYNVDWGNFAVREILVHELIHIEQYKRGFLYRLKMWYWRKFVAYEKRPSEMEAYEKSKTILAGW